MRRVNTYIFILLNVNQNKAKKKKKAEKTFFVAKLLQYHSTSIGDYFVGSAVSFVNIEENLCAHANSLELSLQMLVFWHILATLF